ncbi:MAG: serine/threonine-protein kinase [Candidatus Solibacter sp.]
MKTLQVGEVVGEYRVIGIAGSGGMGVVYKIEHVITRRIEAMKLLPAGLSVDPEQVHRFEREIQVQARLHHPNIVTLYNAIRESDSIALVMEFVEGDSLQRMVAAGPLPVETAVNFAIQVLSALAYAHEAGVIHRDVSPANIIITPDLSAKLSDFGLALGATDLRLSTTGVALGSPWYMSPEQVRGLQKLDARTDLYAMGAVLHEMLTGRKMFEVDGSFAVMRAHVEAVPLTPGSLNSRVPAGLDAIVTKAVAKDPAMRFQSAGEFRSALQRGSLEVAPQPKPSLAGAVPAHLRGVHVSRGAALMALVPVVLAASFFAGRCFPARRAPLRQAASQVIAAPAPVAPEAPAVVAIAPAPVPAAMDPAIATELARPKSPAKEPRKTARTEPNTALRITGGEPLPAAPLPAPRRDTARVVETIEPAAPMNAVAAPETAPTVAAATPAEPAPTSNAAPAANPDGGNRFVRALGKVNPFRRSKKPDPVKNQLKKD